jgi:biopolymer transport protein ExbD
MKLKKPDLIENVGFDMTPMIDIVFQLIVFLMLATDIASTDLARVYLPAASACAEDLNPDKQRLMVNIVHEVPNDRDCPQLKYKFGVLKQPCQIQEHWKIVVKRKEVTKDELLKAIQIEGDIDRPGGAGSKTASNRPLMIRADGSAPYELVEKILEACGRAFVWKIEIGATKPAE